LPPAPAAWGIASHRWSAQPEASSRYVATTAIAIAFDSSLSDNTSQRQHQRIMLGRRSAIVSTSYPTMKYDSELDQFAADTNTALARVRSTIAPIQPPPKH
jgi:hypothetical protein